MKPKVTIVIIAPLDSKLKTNSKAYLSAFNQNYENYDVVIHYEKPRHSDNSLIANLYRNCSENRQHAREMALAGNADYFLFKDWDIIFPKNAISNFVQQTGKRFTSFDYEHPKTKEIIPRGTPVPEVHIQGGWYPLYNKDTNIFFGYPSGYYVGDHVLRRYTKIEKSFVQCDFVGPGCLFVSREVLSKIPFEDGINFSDFDEYGTEIVLGEAGIFGLRAFDLRYPMYMNGSVICGHIKTRSLRKWITQLRWMTQRLIDTLKREAIRLWSRITSEDLFPIR